MVSLESASYWSGVLAVVLTGITAVVGFFAWFFTDKLADQRKRDFDTFRQQSAIDIARANEGAATATQRAAEANEKAEQERLARVKIEERLAGWQLTPEAAAVLTAEMTPLKLTPFDLWVDPKEFRFMQTLDAALISAGWRRVPPKPGFMVIDGKAALRTGYGLAIVVLDSATQLKDPAAALVGALILKGFPVKLILATQGETPDAIHIIIGQRE